jgi:hypothetical protein
MSSYSDSGTSRVFSIMILFIVLAKSWLTSYMMAVVSTFCLDLRNLEAVAMWMILLIYSGSSSDNSSVGMLSMKKLYLIYESA